MLKIFSLSAFLSSLECMQIIPKSDAIQASNSNHSPPVPPSSMNQSITSSPSRYQTHVGHIRLQLASLSPTGGLAQLPDSFQDTCRPSLPILYLWQQERSLPRPVRYSW